MRVVAYQSDANTKPNTTSGATAAIKTALPAVSKPNSSMSAPVTISYAAARCTCSVCVG